MKDMGFKCVSLLFVAFCSLIGTASTAHAADECTQMQPGWIFCNGFEDGNFSIWDDFDGNPAPDDTLVSDAGPFNSAGNHAARLLVAPGQGGADLVKVLPGQNDKLYARWYQYWEPGYDFTVPNHGGGLHAGDRSWLGHSDTRPTGADWFSTWIEPINNTGNVGRMNLYSYYRGMYMDCANPNGACWGDHFPCMVGSAYCTNPAHAPPPTPPQMQAGRWYCIEVMLDGGTPTPTQSGANGQQDFWIDGVELGPWTDLWHRTTSNLHIGILWLNTFFHGTHANVGVRYDNVVVSSDRIGCGAVTEHIGSTVGDPGQTVPVDVTLDDGGASVSSIQLDIGFDPHAPIAATASLAPDCVVNPAIHKDETVYAFQPFGCTPGVDCAAARALILSFFNADPIPTGSTLITCNVAIDPAAPGGTYPLTGSNCVASDPGGVGLTTRCTDGDVTVTGPHSSLLTGARLLLTTPPSGPAKNKLVYLSKDQSLSLAQAVDEDPRCAPNGSGTAPAGATLRVAGAGGDFTIDLPCANWSRNGAGTQYTYRDRSHATCDVIVLKSGRLAKAVCKGAQVAYGLGASQGDVAVVLTTGASGAGRKYCTSFGPATLATVVKDGSDGKKYLAKNATAPASCPP